MSLNKAIDNMFLKNIMVSVGFRRIKHERIELLELMGFPRASLNRLSNHTMRVIIEEITNDDL